MAALKVSEVESGIVTQLELALNTKAPPNFPEPLHVAPVMAPSLPLPEVSCRTVPDPSLKLYWATKLGSGPVAVKFIPFAGHSAHRHHHGAGGRTAGHVHGKCWCRSSPSPRPRWSR